MHYQSVLHFWFEEIEPKQWWQKDSRFDALVRDKFVTYLKAAKQGELFSWRQSAQGRLAEVIVLDQFSRNIFRDQPNAFAQDPLALVLAQEAIAKGDPLKLSKQEAPFLLMPYMHSESSLIHNEAVKLFSNIDRKDSYQFELKHKEIIDQFGRYPHRNAILGRVSTAEEIEFLQQPRSSF